MRPTTSAFVHISDMRHGGISKSSPLCDHGEFAFPGNPNLANTFFSAERAVSSVIAIHQPPPSRPDRAPFARYVACSQQPTDELLPAIMALTHGVAVAITLPPRSCFETRLSSGSALRQTQSYKLLE